MSSSVLPIQIDSVLSAAAIRALTDSAYADKGSIPVAKLVIPESPDTPVSTHFSSSSTKSTLGKLYATKYWTKPPTTATLHPMKNLPLIPFILPSSKVYLALHPNSEHPALCNSFDIIKDIQHAYSELYKLTTLQPKAKAAVDKTRDQVLGDTLTFTSNTLARLFVRGAESEFMLNMLLREVYYATVNLIRVFEYSILDLLGLPEKYQSPLVTVLETDSFVAWKNAVVYSADLVDAHFKTSFLNSYKQTYGVTWTADEMAGAYPSEAILRKHFEISKRTIEDHLFNCGNHDSCKQREMKAKTFAKCAKCKWMRYCSQACQQEHWKAKHKLDCGKPLTEEAAEALFKGRRIIIGAESDSVAAQPSTSSSAPSEAQTNSETSAAAP